MSRISHKYKFIFFAYPKTGSATVRNMLDEYSDIRATTYKKRTKENPFYSHITALETKKIFEERGWDYDSYFKFVVIRNPYSRIVSLYNMSFRNMPFRTYLSKLKNHGSGGMPGGAQDDKWKVNGVYSLLNFAGDGEELLVDQVIKLEDMNSELPKLFTKLGIPPPSKIPRRNIGNYSTKTGKGRDWKEYYDKQTSDKIKQLYGWELAKYNYSNR